MHLSIAISIKEGLSQAEGKSRGMRERLKMKASATSLGEL